MRKFVFGLTALAFAAGSLLGTSSASALTAVQLLNLGATGLVTANDTSREFLENTGPVQSADPNVVDVGDRLTGVLTIETVEYANGQPTQDTGIANEWIVGVFSTEVTAKNDLGGGIFQFVFGAPGGGDGVVATLFSLPGATAFDIAQDGYASLFATFTGGSKLFDVSLIAANGDNWSAISPSDDISVVTFQNPVNFGFDATITDALAGINFANDQIVGNGKAFENITDNNGDFPLANDIDVLFTIEGSVIPEPATAGLMGLGLLATLGMRRRRTA